MYAIEHAVCLIDDNSEELRRFRDNLKDDFIQSRTVGHVRQSPARFSHPELVCALTRDAAANAPRVRCSKLCCTSNRCLLACTRPGPLQG